MYLADKGHSTILVRMVDMAVIVVYISNSDNTLEIEVKPTQPMLNNRRKGTN